MTLPAWAVLVDGDAKFSQRQNAVSGGIVWNLLATVFQIGGALGVLLLLSRLLSEEDFGIYGMVVPFVTILTMVADGGTVYYTLRNPKLEARELSNAFWYCVGIGTCLAILLWAASPVIAWAMAEQRILAVAATMAIALFFASAASQYHALLMRCFRNDLRAYATIGSVIGGFVLSLGLAYAGAGYWALVALLIGRTVLMTLLMVILTGWIPAWPAGFSETLRRVMGLANVELLGRVIISGVRESDRILVGILFTTGQAGFYSLAYMMSIMPLLQLTSPLLFVLLPYLAEERHQPERFFDIVRVMLSALIYLFIAGALFLAFFTDPILSVLIGADMMPSSEIFRILILAAVLSVLVSFMTVPLQAVDRPDLVWKQNMRMAGILVLALVGASYWGGTEAIAWGVLLGNFLALGLRFLALCQHFDRNPGAEFMAIVPALALALLLPLVYLGLYDFWSGWLGGLPELLSFVMLVGGFGVLYLIGAWVLFRHRLRLIFGRDKHLAAPAGTQG